MCFCFIMFMSPTPSCGAIAYDMNKPSINQSINLTPPLSLCRPTAQRMSSCWPAVCRSVDRELWHSWPVQQQRRECDSR